MIRRVKGFTISAEAILISGLMILLLALAFIYATGYLKVAPKISQTWVEARFCGCILVIENTGSVPAYIRGIYYVDSSGYMIDVSFLLPASQREISPGSYVTLKVCGDMVVVTGENFDTVKAKNECTAS